jgi:hypothetical protein
MQQVAKVIDLPTPEVGYAQNPSLLTRTKGNGRAIAVAKFRELADKLESGELDGARCQWLDTYECLVEDADGKQHRLEHAGEDIGIAGTTVISGMEFVTRSAWREDGAGTVQLVAVTIEEEV